MVELTHRLDTILPLDKGPTFRTLHSCHCFEALIAIQDILQSEFVGGTYTSLIRKDTSVSYTHLTLPTKVLV